MSSGNCLDTSSQTGPKLIAKGAGGVISCHLAGWYDHSWYFPSINNSIFLKFFVGIESDKFYLSSKYFMKIIN